MYSPSGSELSQSVYRCHGPFVQKPLSQCTCQPRVLSDFHKSLSIVDYIDYDVSESSTKQDEDNENNDDDDPISYIKHLFKDNVEKKSEQNGNFHRRTPRRSTNTSLVSSDSGYCDISMPPSKLIPVQLVSCKLIPVNVTRTKSMDIHCITCTCPIASPSSSQYFSTNTERRRRKSSTQSHWTYSRQPMDTMENEINNRCSCNNKYYSTMTICPTLATSSSMGIKPPTKIDDNHKDDYYCKQQKKQLRKKRTSLFKFVHLNIKINEIFTSICFLRLPIINDDLTAVSRWYKPHLER